MPPEAYALVASFAVASLVLGVLATQLLARMAAGPRGLLAHVLPVIGAFGALYLIGHRFGIVIGPEIPLFGFQVALLGDLAIGLVAALIVAAIQAGLSRTRRAAA